MLLEEKLRVLCLPTDASKVLGCSGVIRNLSLFFVDYIHNP